MLNELKLFKSRKTKVYEDESEENFINGLIRLINHDSKQRIYIRKYSMNLEKLSFFQYELQKKGTTLNRVLQKNKVDTIFFEYDEYETSIIQDNEGTTLEDVVSFAEMYLFFYYVFIAEKNMWSQGYSELKIVVEQIEDLIAFEYDSKITLFVDGGEFQFMENEIGSVFENFGSDENYNVLKSYFKFGNTLEEKKKALGSYCTVVEKKDKASKFSKLSAETLILRNLKKNYSTAKDICNNIDGVRHGVNGQEVLDDTEIKILLDTAFYNLLAVEKYVDSKL